MLTRRPVAVLARETERLEHLAARARLLDPVHALRRGWSITRDADGNVVRSAADVGPGEVLRTQLADGTVVSEVTTTTVGDA